MASDAVIEEIAQFAAHPTRVRLAEAIGCERSSRIPALHFARGLMLANRAITAANTYANMFMSRTHRSRGECAAALDMLIRLRTCATASHLEIRCRSCIDMICEVHDRRCIGIISICHARGFGWLPIGRGNSIYVADMTKWTCAHCAIIARNYRMVPHTTSDLDGGETREVDHEASIVGAVIAGDAAYLASFIRHIRVASRNARSVCWVSVTMQCAIDSLSKQLSQERQNAIRPMIAEIREMPGVQR
jgi:hypothetical protein